MSPGILAGGGKKKLSGPKKGLFEGKQRPEIWEKGLQRG